MSHFSLIRTKTFKNSWQFHKLKSSLSTMMFIVTGHCFYVLCNTIVIHGDLYETCSWKDVAIFDLVLRGCIKNL